MSMYLVAYDLRQAGQNYDGLVERMKSLGACQHLQQSVWAIEWGGGSVALAQALHPYMDANDELLVTKLTPDTAWLDCSKANGWLAANL